MKSFSPLVGWHVGTCTNTTVGATDNLMLTIFGVTDSTLHGELTLAGVLGGGSAFQGTIANNQIRFTTVTPAAQFAVTWQATLSDEGVTGTYVARFDDPEVRLAWRQQQGIWRCKLIRPLGAPNPDDAQRVWVYYDGSEEGPFNAEEFNQRLASGQWPPNAIVGLNDQTSWLTAADCLDKLQAEAATRN